jgi:type I restriction enzyme M protein
MKSYRFLEELRLRRVPDQVRAGDEEKMKLRSKTRYAPLKLYGQEYEPSSWAMANMNMIIHDLEGRTEIGHTFKVETGQSCQTARAFCS